ncbi:tetratricopeptide repeat protein [Pirellulaceae bacterium SH449]
MKQSKHHQPISTLAKIRIATLGVLTFAGGTMFPLAYGALCFGQDETGGGQDKKQKTDPPALVIPVPKPGEEDFDKAIQLRIKVDSTDKLKEAITLAESAIEKGLSEDSEVAAKRFLGSAYSEKAKINIQAALQGGGPRSRRSKLLLDALDDVSKAIGFDASQTEAYIIKAQILADRQEFEGAREILNQGIEYFTPLFEARKNSENRQSLSRLYDARAAMGDDVEEQLADLEKAVEINPVDDMLSKKLLSALGQTGQFDKILLTLDRMLGVNPESVELISTKIATLLRLDQIDEAIAFSTSSIGLLTEDESRAAVLRQRALLYQSKSAAISIAELSAEADEESKKKSEEEAKKILELAKADLDESLKLMKDNVQSIFLRARLAAQMEDAEAARRDIDIVLETDDQNLEALLFSGELAVAEGDFERAAKEFKTLSAQFADGSPQKEELLKKLAIAYWQSNQIKPALRTLDQVIRGNSSSWEAYRLRGEIYLGQGEHLEATVAYEKALRLMPDTASPAQQSNLLNNYAWILSTSPEDNVRDGERALELGLKACEMTDFTEAHLVSTLAAAYAEAGDFEKAVEYAKKAVELGEKEESEQIEQLREELKSYQEKKPWREKNSPADAP